MNDFMVGMGSFAAADIYNGEDLYAKWFVFVETVAKNVQFEFYGSDNLIMLLNSGSYFILQT